VRQKCDYIFFTGSEMVGKVVLRAASEHLTPVTLELGGKSPVIVHHDADIPLAARRIIWGKLMNAGQTCIAPDYVFVHNKVREPLLNAMVKQIETFYGKNVQKSPDLGRIVNHRHLERLQNLLAQHKDDIMTGGEVDNKDRYMAPTILKNVKPDSPIMKEEIFGPILPTMGYEDVEQVISFINARPKPLALYLFTSNENIIKSVTTKTSSGGVSVNDVIMHYCNSNMPFGGVGTSGMGSYHGKFGFRTFSHSKAVLLKSRYLDASIRYPPYSDSKYSAFRYAAEIYRINTDSFKRLFYEVFLPIIIAGVAHSCGAYVRFGFRSNL